MLSEAQIDEVKARADLAGLALELGAKLRASGGKLVGSCPICGGKGQSSTRFEIARDGQGWVCAVCEDGGDAIRLVMKATGCDFPAAIARLGGPRALTPAEARALDERRRAESAKAEADADAYRRREIAAALRIWDSGHAVTALRAGRYLAARGLALPGTAEIRQADEVRYFHGETVDERGRCPRLIAATPAMLALIRDRDGAPSGVHITHLAADWSAKATLTDPETGEVLPAKKMRGSKKGGSIVLRAPQGAMTRLFLAEGIETCLSVATSMRQAGALGPGDGFRAAGDLGNLGGPHLGTIAHPTMTSASGRPARVPGPEPDLGKPGMAIPPSVETLVLLGDGDSEPVLTRATLERARARHLAERAALRGRDASAPPLRVAIAMAPEGRDFNDMIRGA